MKTIGQLAASDVYIRPARFSELDILSELEIDACHALIEAGALFGDASATPRPLMEQACLDQLLFVAAGPDDQPLGFLAAAECDGGLYIGEIDVWRRWQGRGIGSKLITAALTEARGRSAWGAMLTTDRFAPFNYPFYFKLGFREVPTDRCPAKLAAVLKAEIDAGYDRSRRVAMVLRFAADIAPEAKRD
jgi:GNAT superfamily N-acetyltransferase